MSQRLVILGLGYVGLPLVEAAVETGWQVTGFDVSTAVVDGLNAGKSHVDDLSDATIAGLLAKGFTATTDDSVLADADVAVICVPTPLADDGGPDLRAVLSATRTIAKHLHKGMLVVLESTTYPGTTDEDVRPILEAGGLIAGTDFNLAFSPERIDPGNPVYGMRNTPKVVGGQTPACTDRCADFYGSFVEKVVRARGTREAEAAKILENTFRHVNIALMNEMARFCHELGIDLWDVIDAAKTKPFGFMPFYPGPGVGGHCIPIDPNYLSYKVRADLGYPFRFVELAQEINNTMPAYTVSRISELLNERSKPLRGSRILLLGVTYKPDISDQRETPSRPVADQLIAKGADVVFHDPHVKTWTVATGDLTCVDNLLDEVKRADITVVLQTHTAYNFDEIAAAGGTIFDTRGKLRQAGVTRL
ncbi:MAG: nucleotide sugar dehydrogenase [Actinobacteria bacterium]|nr:nucleotide sugar dehydrogenase [Actinomycetota bacterium]